MSASLKLKPSLINSRTSQSPLKNSLTDTINNYSPQMKPKAKGALQMNPFLSPKTEINFNSTSTKASELVSMRKTSSARIPKSNQKEKPEKAILKASLSNYKSPQPKTRPSTATIYSPHRSSVLTGEDPTKQYVYRSTERVQIRKQEGKEMKLESKMLGGDQLENHIQRKEMETHVLVLENRIKKLQMEDMQITKKIYLTSEKTEIILENKKRHHEKLTIKEERARKLEQEVLTRQQHLQVYKEQVKEKLNTAQLEKFRSKHDLASTMKEESGLHRTLKQELREAQEKKIREMVEKRHQERQQKETINQVKVIDKREQAKQSYKSKAEQNQIKKQELADKCKQLENIEQRLLEKLSNTYSVHKAKVQQMEKAFNIKVNTKEAVIWDENEERGDTGAQAENEEEQPEEQEEEVEEIEERKNKKKAEMKKMINKTFT